MYAVYIISPVLSTYPMPKPEVEYATYARIRFLWDSLCEFAKMQCGWHTCLGMREAPNYARNFETIFVRSLDSSKENTEIHLDDTTRRVEHGKPRLTEHRHDGEHGVIPADAGVHLEGPPPRLAGEQRPLGHHGPAEVGSHVGFGGKGLKLKTRNNNKLTQQGYDKVGIGTLECRKRYLWAPQGPEYATGNQCITVTTNELQRTLKGIPALQAIVARRRPFFTENYRNPKDCVERAMY